MRASKFLSAIIAGVAVSAACGGSAPSSGSSQQKPALRVAIVTSQSGPYAVIGAQAIRAVNFAVKEANAKGGIKGRPVEAVLIDDQGTTDGAVQAANRAVKQEHAPFITGIVASSQSLAIAATIDQLNGLYVATISKTDTLTGKNCDSRVFRANKSDSMDLNAVGPWLKDRPEKTWSILAADYEWGHDSAKAFTATAEKLGRKVDKTLYSPLGTKDYSPYIAQLAASGSEGLWVSLSGGDANNFAQQAISFGLLKRFTAVVGNNFVTDATMKTVGDGLVGVWGTVNYAYTLDTPANRKFVEEWHKEYARTNPSNFEGKEYVGMQLLFAAVAKADSIDPAKVAKAMSGLTTETVFGSSQMRAADHQLVSPNYVGQVTKVASGLAYKITVTANGQQASPAANPDCHI
jgi:branched-chain amino acid transport system substrate-binding protein